MTDTAASVQPERHSWLVSIARGIRDGILIVGVSVLLVVAVEACVRLWGAASESLSRRGAEGPPSPSAGKPWVAEFNREFDATRAVGWQSYVYFRRLPSYHGKYVNIDSLRHRVTPQPSTPTVPAARVFFLGGSTMWGSFQRDDHTIAAEASRRLQDLVAPGGRVEVTNLGEQGWVNSQELIELMLQLRAGNRPDVVVFVDGINDPFATLQSGRAGLPENEQKRVDEFAMGRKLDRSLYGHGLKTDLKAMATLALAGLQHLESFQLLSAHIRHDSAKPLSVDSAATATIRVYAENVRLVEALAAAYHFTPIYVWQPTLQATDKKLTPFEESLLRPKGQPINDRLGDVYIAIPPRLDSAMAGVVEGRFVDATHAFKGSPVPVFMDRVGHNSEESIPVIVDAFWPQLSAAVRSAMQRSGHR